jgi:hypothetical protein
MGASACAGAGAFAGTGTGAGDAASVTGATVMCAGCAVICVEGDGVDDGHAVTAISGARVGCAIVFTAWGGVHPVATPFAGENEGGIDGADVGGGETIARVGAAGGAVGTGGAGMGVVARRERRPSRAGGCSCNRAGPAASIGFARQGLDWWERQQGRNARMVGFSTHYNVSIEGDRTARSMNALARLLTYILPAPVMLLALNKQSSGVGVRPRRARRIPR